MSKPTDNFASSLPAHLGVIIDGNRRWAKANNQPQLEGHRRGYENIKRIGDAALARGIKFMTIYAFSTENWQRSSEEVDYLLRKLFWIAMREIDDLHRKNVRVLFAGSRDKLEPKAVEAMAAVEAKTAANTRGTFVLCFNYGGQAEIADAVSQIVREGIAPEDITTQTVADHLYVPEVPPVDLIIRTSGEQRLSNFMLWRAAYSELKFVDTYWPDFSEADLDACLADYAARARRFGN